MLLYHFPLINDYSNKGFANLYDGNGNVIPLTTLTTGFASGGIIASTAKGVTQSLGLAYLEKNYTDFSIVFRFYKYGYSTGHLIVMKLGTSGKVDLNVNLAANKLQIGYYNTVSASMSWEYDKAISDGQHTMAILIQGSSTICYLDNNLVINISSVSRNRLPYFFGTNFNGQNNGNPHLIQDVRIYDKILSQAEINEYSRAMVVHYPLNGNVLNPSVLKDVSGFGNDYTLQGTNSYQLDSARGVKSLHTTDTAIYTQTPISSGYTTSFWCKYNEEWKHLCNNGSKYVNGVVNSSLYDTIYATLTASGYDIADYRVYATALSAEDIKNLYNSPIAVSKQHQTMAFEFKENPLYPSKYWRTPTYAEMNYILNTRTNAANLRTLSRVEISSGVYRNGLFLLPDDWVLPAGVTMTITTSNYTTNSYSLDDFVKLENNGAVFLAFNGNRNGVAYSTGSCALWLGNHDYAMNIYASATNWFTDYFRTRHWFGFGIRLCQQGTKFAVSANSKIDFAPSYLQYHCTQHIWRFAEHSYDIIGAANANISDSYNGWIDLFGYGTSGINYSPTLHTTNNADYASGDIANTDNDWGINEIQSYDYNVKNFAAKKNGIVQHNELIEGSADGCYQDKLITNELIEQ